MALRLLLLAAGFNKCKSVHSFADLACRQTRNHHPPVCPSGLAVEGDRVLGAVVLSFANEPDGGLTYWQYSQRVGCIPTLLTLAYDHVLEEPLHPSECLIDFIAVAPEARGRGVGATLMAWAESAGSALLAARSPAAVAAAGGSCISLWVAADNTVACRLYIRSGYTAVKRTDTGVCQCVMTRVLKRFLGHPVWIKMSKQLAASPGRAMGLRCCGFSSPGCCTSPHSDSKPQVSFRALVAAASDLATTKPVQQTIELMAGAGTRDQQPQLAPIDRFELTPLPDDSLAAGGRSQTAKQPLPIQGNSPAMDRIAAHGGSMLSSLHSPAVLGKASIEVGATVVALVRTISTGAGSVVTR